MQGWFNNRKFMNISHLKGKKITLIDADNMFNKIQFAIT